MLLAVDYGNSRIKLGIFKADQLTYFDSWDQWNSKSWKKLLQKFLPKKILVSSVVNIPAAVIKELLGKIPAVILNAGHFSFIINHYETPQTLGTDRLANLAGGRALFPAKNILVISAGTCITYDVLTKSDEYFGGNISPGLEMRLKAMHHFTSKLPLVKKEQTEKLIGKDTQSSMLTGSVSGAAFEMQGFMNAYKKKYHSLKVILTGGDASFFETRLKSETFAVPNLVLIGLNEMAKLNES